MVVIPSPVPGWFYEWEVWVKNGKPIGKRPKSAPKEIPKWAFQLYLSRIPKGDGGKDLWDKLGQVNVYADKIDNAIAAGKRCKQFGYGYAACSVHTDIGRQNNDRTIAEWLYNIQVGADWTIAAGGWGPDFNLEPEVAANRAADAVERHNLAFYLPDWEKSYEFNTKIERWLTVFRTRLPKIPLMGLPLPYMEINHKLLQDLGIDLGPQTYYGENGSTPEWATWTNTHWPVPPWPGSRIHCGINIGYKEVSEAVTKILFDKARALGMTGGYGWGYYDPNKIEHWRCLVP